MLYIFLWLQFSLRMIEKWYRICIANEHALELYNISDLLLFCHKKFLVLIETMYACLFQEAENI